VTVPRRRPGLSFSAVFATFLALGACGTGPSSLVDGGGADGGDPIVGDDDAPQPGDCPDLRCRAGTLPHACVCVPTPRTDPAYATVRTTCAQIAAPLVPRTPERDFCVEGAENQPPDLSCFGVARRVPGPSRMVTLYGVVDVFGNGGDADGITLEVRREGPGGELGEVVGTAISSVADPCAETEIEIENGMPTGEMRRLGFYTIAGVPTETPLILVTRGDSGLWKPLYTYNFVVLNEEVESGAPPPGACPTTPTGDRYRYRARALSVSDYRTIPLTAGIAGGIPAGRGAIAGEIHDCANVRLAFAMVGIRPSPETFVYFTDDADNPLPDLSRTEGTSLLGLYAGLDLPPGPVDVSALGRVNGRVVSLGWYRARIFADSVTVVSLRGLRPHQVRQK
jgi:hypothetical protein